MQCSRRRTCHLSRGETSRSAPARLCIHRSRDAAIGTAPRGVCYLRENGPANAAGSGGCRCRRQRAEKKKRRPRRRSLRHGRRVNRACQPPANGVENCETDADRAVARAGSPPAITHLSRVRINAMGLAPPTGAGTGRMSLPEVSSGGRSDLQTTPWPAVQTLPPAPLAQPRHPPPAVRLTNSPCCCRSCGRGSSCRCGR